MIRVIYKKIKNILIKISRLLKKKIPVYIPVLQNELLNGRCALITGGTRGIGYEIAKAYLNSGAKVVITGRSEENVKKSVEKLLIEKNAEDRIFGIALDNTKDESFSEKFSQAVEFCGKIDILVNNAGVIAGGNFGNVDSDGFNLTIDTNLKGTFMMSQIVASYMKSNKIEGNILNICSSSSLRPAISPYTLSKWGIRGLTLGLAKMLAPYGITVNGLAPGPTATEMLIKDDYDGIELNSNPSGRYATAEEIANMAVILTSSIGKMIIGDIVYITGGAGVITFDDMNYNF